MELYRFPDTQLAEIGCHGVVWGFSPGLSNALPEKLLLAAIDQIFRFVMNCAICVLTDLADFKHRTISLKVVYQNIRFMDVR